MIFPPSPALSACDSLSGIEDLDAFLALQGGLSHFPTPPMKSEARDSELDPDKRRELTFVDGGLVRTDPIANAFATEAAVGSYSTALAADTIHHMLLRADLPLEVVAVAFNLISALRNRPPDLTSCPADLLVVAALSLAVSYTDDHAPVPAWYSRHVCCDAHTPQSVDRTSLQLLAALEWHIHKFTTPQALGLAMLAFYTPTVTESVESEAAHAKPIPVSDPSETQSLKLVTSCSPSIVRWKHGAYTPEDSPPGSAFEACSPSATIRNCIWLSIPAFDTSVEEDPLETVGRAASP